MKNLLEKIAVLFVLIMIAAATAVFAHPGHGTSGGHSLAHYLSEPVHIISVIAVVTIFALITRWVLIMRTKKVKAMANSNSDA